MSKIVGIDLGTTFSAIAILDDLGNPEVLSDPENNNRITRSAVYIGREKAIVGDKAVDAAVTNRKNVIFEVKSEMENEVAWSAKEGVWIERKGKKDSKGYVPSQVSSIILSKLKDYVSLLEKKENTVVGNRGIKVSGGQKQRIGIARALYHNPKILILDEATSSLDTINERKIMEEIYNIAENITLIIVTHRHKSVSNCDKIYLLDNGKIIDEGKLADLEKRHSL